MATILYVDDEPSVGLIIEDTLERAGHTPVGARSVPEALQILARGGVDLIVSDYRMPGLTGLEFLSLLQRDGCDVPVIMLTGYASIEHAVASIKAGAIDYMTKPVRPQQFELAVEQALELVRLRRENEALRREVMEFRNERTDHRRVQRDPAHPADGRDGGAHARHRAPAGRERNRQGAVRARDPRPERAAGPSVHPAQLRRPARGPHRERAVRPRARRVHGRDQAGGGRIRAGPPRHAAPGRDQRDAARPAVQAVARPAGTGVRAGGWNDADPRGRARDRDDEPRPGERGRRRARSAATCITAWA